MVGTLLAPAVNNSITRSRGGVDPDDFSDRARPMKSVRAISLAVVLVTALGGCAALGALGQVIEAPHFEVDQSRSPELRLQAPSAGLPTGGAVLRLWARVENPNAIGINLSRVAGDLYLQDSRATAVDFPLGIPLRARESTVVPMEIHIDFSQLPGLADTAVRALTGAPLAYRLDGTVGVDAGPFGTPSFGPMTLLAGDVRAFR